MYEACKIECKSLSWIKKIHSIYLCFIRVLDEWHSCINNINLWKNIYCQIMAHEVCDVGHI